MISMRQAEALGTVNVDFDEYVPLTITWSSSSRMLEAPMYVALQDVNGYLEFKFDPFTGILIEVVLAAARVIQVERDNLSPGNSEDASLMPFLDSGDATCEMRGPLVIRAYADYLYISFGPDPDQWVGSGPVLFGLARKQSFAAICASWTASERASVLAGRLRWRKPLHLDQALIRCAFGTPKAPFTLHDADPSAGRGDDTGRPLWRAIVTTQGRLRLPGLPSSSGARGDAAPGTLRLTKPGTCISRGLLAARAGGTRAGPGPQRFSFTAWTRLTAREPWAAATGGRFRPGARAPL